MEFWEKRRGAAAAEFLEKRRGAAASEFIEKAARRGAGNWPFEKHYHLVFDCRRVPETGTAGFYFALPLAYKAPKQSSQFQEEPRSNLGR